jgi:hypothetical protein
MVFLSSIEKRKILNIFQPYYPDFSQNARDEQGTISRAIEDSQRASDFRLNH